MSSEGNEQENFRRSDYGLHPIENGFALSLRIRGHRDVVDMAFVGTVPAIDGGVNSFRGK